MGKTVNGQVERAKLLSKDDLQRTFRRLAHQFAEPFEQLDSLAIIGMQTRGVYIAQRVQQHMHSLLDKQVPVGVLDVSFYRDDFRARMKMPEVKITDIPFDLYEKDLVLVDDVLYTGRTLRAAMEAIISFGRPSSIRFCCLVDRGHHELPVRADYTGIYVPTHRDEEVRVEVEEVDGNDGVFVVQTNHDQGE